jgi:hypothetical protein
MRTRSLCYVILKVSHLVYFKDLHYSLRSLGIKLYQAVRKTEEVQRLCERGHCVTLYLKFLILLTLRTFTSSLLLSAGLQHRGPCYHYAIPRYMGAQTVLRVTPFPQHRTHFLSVLDVVKTSW